MMRRIALLAALLDALLGSPGAADARRTPPAVQPVVVVGIPGLQWDEVSAAEHADAVAAGPCRLGRVAVDQVGSRASPARLTAGSPSEPAIGYARGRLLRRPTPTSGLTGRSADSRRSSRTTTILTSTQYQAFSRSSVGQLRAAPSDQVPPSAAPTVRVRWAPTRRP